MAVVSTQIVNVPAIGGAVTIDTSAPIPELIALWWDTYSLSNDFSIDWTNSALIPDGTVFQLGLGGADLDLNGHTFTAFGLTITQEMINTKNMVFSIYLANTGGLSVYPVGYIQTGTPYQDGVIIPNLNGATLFDGTVKFAKLEALASGKTIVGNGSNVAVADYIKNANIDASAGIARTKIASGTASRVVVNDGTGALAELAQLTPALGGTGIDTSESTGFSVVSAGTHSVGALTETIRVDVSFVTASQGTYYVALPACTVTKVKARVTSAMSATDDGTITCQNASSTNMTSGLLTLPASSAHGTGVSVTPSANNTFSSGSEMQLVVSKFTSGGTCSVDITFTRTALS